ncbi:MAG: polysaccharide pyruvyl transferase family protein [Clostridia bacterium]|nr:polysaccharide pyruvyl transferase family protein [Clostridia bacterium]
MKIAIVTLHRVYNYGSALQAYATQKVFENRGYSTRIIDYITPQRTKWKLFWGKGAKNQSGIAYRIAKVGSFFLKEKTFGHFVRTKLNLTKKYITVEDLEKDIPKADVYVTGSDQTWNSQYNEGIDRGFFLDFLPENTRRIAFVASFGKTKLDVNEVSETKRLLSRYEKISVREDSAVHIVSGLGLQAPVQLIDPTLMLEKSEWVAIASPRLVKEPYLILMLLYNEDNHATEYARKIADEKGLKLVKVSWETKKPFIVDQLFTHRSPSDFLSLFYYADFVVTNSFHGLAFSINFEKQFIMVPRNEYNSRIESLLRLTGLDNRLVSEETQLCVINERIEYQPVREQLLIERKRAEEFIEEALP